MLVLELKKGECLEIRNTETKEVIGHIHKAWKCRPGHLDLALDFPREIRITRVRDDSEDSLTNDADSG